MKRALNKTGVLTILALGVLITNINFIASSSNHQTDNYYAETADWNDIDNSFNRVESYDQLLSEYDDFPTANGSILSGQLIDTNKGSYVFGIDEPIVIEYDITEPIYSQHVKMKLTIDNFDKVENKLDDSVYQVFVGINQPSISIQNGLEAVDWKLEWYNKFGDAVNVSLLMNVQDVDKKQTMVINDLDHSHFSVTNQTYLRYANEGDSTFIGDTPDPTFDVDASDPEAYKYQFVYTKPNANESSGTWGKLDPDPTNSGAFTALDFRYFNPDTVVTKQVVDQNHNQVAESGEVLNYQLQITNPNSVYDAMNIHLRDSLLEDLPSYISFNDDLTIDNPEIRTSGSLQTGDFTIVQLGAGESINITYSVTVDEIPSDVEQITNVVTNNEQNPAGYCDSTTASNECDGTEIAVNEPTLINKTVADENGNGIAEDGETLSYKLDIINPSADNQAVNVLIRDSILETIDDYEYLSWDRNFTVGPEPITYSGDLAAGTFTLDSVPAGSTVSIGYQIEIESIPDGVDDIVNVATDNGSEPVIESCVSPSDDCTQVNIPTNPQPVIKKSVTDENKDGYVQSGETLTYQLDVINPNSIDALDISVSDSLIEGIERGIYPYVTYNNDLEVVGSKYTGDLASADLILNKIAANEQVSITFTVTVTKIPNDIGKVLNVANDNRSDPIDVDTNLPIGCQPENIDCAQVSIPVDPDPVVNKTVVDENHNNIAEDGEILNYTLEITNPNTEADGLNIAVRDSLLETIDDYEYLSWDGNLIVTPDPITYHGDLKSGTFVLDRVPANSTVSISYQIEIGELPTNIDGIRNTVTVNQTSPIDPSSELPLVCELGSSWCSSTIIEVVVNSKCAGLDPKCSQVIEATNSQVVLKKSQIDENRNNILEDNEKIKYTITVTNENPTVDAIDVLVRDSMLEQLPDYLQWNQEIEVSTGIDYAGNLADGTFVIERLPAGQSADISYVLEVKGQIPQNINNVINIAITNGVEPGQDQITSIEQLTKISDKHIALTNIQTNNTTENNNQQMIVVNDGDNIKNVTGLTNTGSFNNLKLILAGFVLDIYLLKKLAFGKGKNEV